MSTKLIRYTVIASVLFFALSAMSDVGKMSAKDGIERLKLNVANARANMDDYQKNLKIVDGNLAEISKVKTSVESQKTEITSILKQNDTAMKTVDKHEQEINKIILSEEKETLAEDTKVKELEKIIAQLKANQEKRKANVAQYKEQLKQVTVERTEWKSRHEQLLKQQKDVTDRLAAIKKTEKDWQAKHKGYESEMNKWAKETDKHQKLHDQYTN